MSNKIQDKRPLVLHNWFEFSDCVMGQIYNDRRRTNPNDRRRTNPNDGSMQMTSYVKLLDRERGILITKNTTYHLGKEVTQEIE